MVHPQAMLTVACVNWGTKYPPLYVSILEAMVKRNLTVPHEFVCLTDKPENYTCKTIKLPEGLEGWWNKVYLFKKGLFNGKVLFLDLDVVITGSLDDLVKLDGFVSIKDWNYDSYNSSVMILGDNPEIWDDFTPEVAKRWHGDQDWITDKLPFRNYFPDEWCLSYRRSCIGGVPEGCKVVVFHGEPKPHNSRSHWVKKLWKV